MIDNYDAVKESPLMEAYEDMMMKVTREGLALGIYIILTGSRLIKSANSTLRRALPYIYSITMS